MEAFIVRNSEGVYIPSENEDLPINVIFTKGKHIGGIGRFQLSNNDVLFEWSAQSGIVIRYKGLLLKQVVGANALQVCDFLNLYKTYSREQIEEEYNKKQIEVKTTLEKEVNSLRHQKKELDANVKVLKQIAIKGKELKELISKLPN